MKYYDRKDYVFNSIVYVILIIFTIVMIFPLIYIVANSISSFNDVYNGNVWLIPKNITFKAYEMVLSNDMILIGYKNTIIYTLVGTLISLFLTFTAAYPLSRRDFSSKKIMTIIFVITMFFNGGLIPTYMVVDQLGLINTMFGFILPGCLSVWNVLVVKTYINASIPWELQESAKIDGCSDIKLFIKIILPLCKPIIAVMVLFYAVAYWNSYFNSLIYLSDNKLFPLQRVLTDILISADVSSMTGSGGIQPSLNEQGKMLESLQYATIILSSIPMLILYPFIQKYFAKGMMVGSIKG